MLDGVFEDKDLSVHDKLLFGNADTVYSMIAECLLKGRHILKETVECTKHRLLIKPRDRIHSKGDPKEKVQMLEREVSRLN